MKLSIFAEPASADSPARIERALTETFREGGRIIKEQGRASIASGGLGAKWQNAFRVKSYPEHGTSGAPAIYAYHKIPYAGVFEKGAAISGKPMLWIPLPNVPMGTGGRRISPKKFTQTIGPLYSIKNGKRPMLAAVIKATDARAAKGLSLALLRRGRNPGGRGTVRLVPVYVGVSAVHDPKKFDIERVVARVSSALNEIHSAKFRNDG